MMRSNRRVRISNEDKIELPNIQSTEGALIFYSIFFKGNECVYFMDYNQVFNILLFHLKLLIF